MTVDGAGVVVEDDDPPIRPENPGLGATNPFVDVRNAGTPVVVLLTIPPPAPVESTFNASTKGVVAHKNAVIGSSIMVMIAQYGLAASVLHHVNIKSVMQIQQPYHFRINVFVGHEPVHRLIYALSTQSVTTGHCAGRVLPEESTEVVLQQPNHPSAVA